MGQIYFSFKIIALAQVGKITPVASGLNTSDHLQRIPLKTLQEEFGHKLANSVRAAHLAGGHSSPKLPIDVPKFAGLPQSYFIRLMNVGGRLDTLWQQYNNVKTDPIKREIVTKAIGELIAETFSADSRAVQDITDSLIEEFGADTLLALRSTSREDTKESANAGGNASVCSVSITPQAISDALCTVLGSYFSDQSIGRRSISETDVAEMPLLAAMFQKMVTDTAGPSPSVVSGVLGSIETFGQTKDVTLIQSTFGHGSGIVDSSLGVSADSTLVGSFFQIRETGDKSFRVMPSLENPEHTEKNAPELALQPTVNHPLAKLLKNYARRCEAEFKGPVDIEWVYDRTQNKLWIVQVRPLIIEDEITPHYLRVNTGCAPLMMAKVESGNMNAVEIKRPNEEILFAKTDVEALSIIENAAMASNGKTISTKVVILQHPPKTLSHEVMELRSSGIIVLVASGDSSRLKEAIRQRIPLTICTQQGIISASEGCTIQAGYSAYPKQFKKPKIELSSEVKSHFRTMRPITPSALPGEILIRLAQNLNLMNARVRDGKDYSIFLESTGQLLGQLKSIVDHYPATIFNACKSLIDDAFAMLDAILNNGPENQPISFMLTAQLKSLILGESEDRSNPESISGHVQLMQQYEVFIRETQTIEAVKTNPNLRIRGFQLWALRRPGLPDIQNQWLNFCLANTEPPDHFHKASESLRFLSKYRQLESVAVTRLSLGVAAWGAIRSTTNELQRLQSKITLQLNDLTLLEKIRWGSPMPQEDFDTFRQMFEQAIGIQNIVQLWGSTKSVEARRFILDHTLYLINFYDQAIKKILGSTEFSGTPELKDTRISEMLKGFVNILRSLATLNPSILSDYLRAHLQARIDHYSTQLQAPPNTSKNKDFNVSKWTFGHPYWLNHGVSDSEFEAQIPRATGELFTAIHQDLMGIIQMEQVGLLGNLESLSEQHRAVHSTLLGNLFDPNQAFFRINCVSCQIDDASIETRYNIPLRAHSSSITIRSDRDTGILDMSVSLFGENEYSRWENAATIARLLEAIGLTAQTSCLVHQNGITVNFRIPQSNSDSPMILLKAAKIFVATSYAPTNRDEKVVQALSGPLSPPDVPNLSFGSLIETLRYFGISIPEKPDNTLQKFQLIVAQHPQIVTMLSIESISEIPGLLKLFVQAIQPAHPAYSQLLETIRQLAKAPYDIKDSLSKPQLLPIFLAMQSEIFQSKAEVDQFTSDFFKGIFESLIIFCLQSHSCRIHMSAKLFQMF